MEASDTQMWVSDRVRLTRQVGLVSAQVGTAAVGRPQVTQGRKRTRCSSFSDLHFGIL
jgi:hypothetical protein